MKLTGTLYSYLTTQLMTCVSSAELQRILSAEIQCLPFSLPGSRPPRLACYIAVLTLETKALLEGIAVLLVL